MPLTDMQSPYYILVEIFEREENSVEKLYNFLEDNANLISDGVVPRDEK